MNGRVGSYLESWSSEHLAMLIELVCAAAQTLQDERIKRWFSDECLADCVVAAAAFSLLEMKTIGASSVTQAASGWFKLLAVENVIQRCYG